MDCRDAPLRLEPNEVTVRRRDTRRPRSNINLAARFRDVAGGHAVLPDTKGGNANVLTILVDRSRSRAHKIDSSRSAHDAHRDEAVVSDDGVLRDDRWDRGGARGRAAGR